MVGAVNLQKRYQLQKQQHPAFLFGPRHTGLRAGGKGQRDMWEKEREHDGLE
jgi:hypothetical protein